MGAKVIGLRGASMFKTLIRAAGGFLLACFAAGLTQVLFVITPVQLATVPANEFGVRAVDVVILALLAATHSAIFGAIFALIAIVIGEWLGIAMPIYYALTGAAIALLGLFAQYSSEVTGQPTILNTYAFATFLAAGLAAGLVYWWAAGRRAGGRHHFAGTDIGASAVRSNRKLNFKRPDILAGASLAKLKRPSSLKSRLEQADVTIATKAGNKAEKAPETATSEPATKGAGTGGKDKDPPATS